MTFVSKNMIFSCSNRLKPEMGTIIVTVLLTILSVAMGDDCQRYKNSDCACKSGSFVLDLKSLVEGQPRPLFKDYKASSDNDTYSYNPCLPFDEGCKSAAVCQKTFDGQFFSLGSQPSVTYLGDPHKGNVTFRYHDKDTDYDRIAEVEIVCKKGTNRQFSAVGQVEKTETPDKKIRYKFILYTELACVSGGLSLGSILLILFFVFLLIYILGGMLFMRFARGAKGWEQIPHYEFWYEFPLYVRDGVVFTINGCKTETTYEKI